ncbi:MAG: FAD-dependent oxidoreductase [Phycisphaeraceae bacterium]|nr:FAD-dependent oxidoreductase [Phycisphaeraceae bacterium]
MSDQTKRTIVIVGGVAGGASAATRARRLNENARIIMLEKDQYVSFANCGLPYYIGGEIAEREKLLVAKPELFEKRFNIEVRIGHEALAIDRARRVIRVQDRGAKREYEQAYDRLILAPGASPIVPPLAGIDAGNVFSLRNVEDTDRVKKFIDEQKPKRAVVVGAGFIGLEMVEQLARLGMQTALVELADQVLPLLDPEMAAILEEELKQRGVELYVGDGLAGFEVDESKLARAVKLNSGKTVGAQMFVLGIGVRPNTGLAEQAKLELGPTRGIKVNAHQQTSDPFIYAAGDAVEYVYGPTGSSLRVPLAGPANRAGRLAGEHAATDGGAEMGEVWGTSIVRVFGKTAGMTGLTMKLAAKLGKQARSVIIQANHHAGYYPGAQAMVLKLVYEEGSGKVLGAQAVGGEEGVDKRLDVLATALHFGATVRDLTELDLAYAPPFGSAKDAVHMAGFAACNEMDGHVRVIPPDQALAGMQVVDLRTAKEVATAPLLGVEGATVRHVPVDELRARLAELDPRQPTVTVCASGLRSYIGARILKAHGFTDVRNLTGGASMRRIALSQTRGPCGGGQGR